MTLPVAILGGGIAGLTTAIALQKVGIYAEVFEAAPEFKAVGAGLLLAANAVKGYEHIGMADQIIQQGRQLPYFKILDQAGRIITAADAGKIGRKYGLHNFAIHRARLHESLTAALTSQQLHTGWRAVGVKNLPNGRVEVQFSGGNTIQTHALIVADGIHSAIRQQLVTTSKPRYAGYTCWRGIIDAGHLHLDAATETWGKGARFGIVPLAENKVYWFACLNAPENDPAMRAKTVDDLKGDFQDFHAPVQEILSLTRNEDLLWNDIIDLKPIPQYAFGSTVLIGDAAHATTPNMGQGACQAIEDAVILAGEMAREADPIKAFRMYEKKRLSRTHWIVNNSWSLGKIAQIENAWLANLRNQAFRLIPNSVNERQMRKVLEVSF